MTAAVRPQYNPSSLVHRVMEMLGERYGIATEITAERMTPAVNAAADLLRALGVDPTTAPIRPRSERHRERSE